MCSLQEIPHLSCANKAGTKSAKLLPMANGVSSLQKGWKRSCWLGAFAFWFWDSRNRTYRTTARFFIALNPNDARKYGLVIPVIPVNVVGGTLKIWKIQRDLTWQTKKQWFLAALKECEMTAVVLWSCWTKLWTQKGNNLPLPWPYNGASRQLLSRGLS